MGCISPFYLFGGPRPFLPPPWITTDDRVRNGSSQSFLTARPNNGALFYGHLDITTLGGAGFASQYSPAATTTGGKGTTPPKAENQARGGGAPWDLTAYAGLQIRLGKGDGKLYTLILKDAENSQREQDGREKTGFSWEAEFRANDELKEERGGKYAAAAEKEGQEVSLPWADFKPTFRGRETDGEEKLDRSNITTVGLMMRSYFGTQEGDFKLEVESITAQIEFPTDRSKESKEE